MTIIDLESVMFHATSLGRYEAICDNYLLLARQHSESPDMAQYYDERAQAMRELACQHAQSAEKAAARVRAVLFAAADREAQS